MYVMHDIVVWISILQSLPSWHPHSAWSHENFISHETQIFYYYYHLSPPIIVFSTCLFLFCSKKKFSCLMRLAIDLLKVQARIRNIKIWPDIFIPFNRKFHRRLRAVRNPTCMGSSRPEFSITLVRAK